MRPRLKVRDQGAAPRDAENSDENKRVSVLRPSPRLNSCSAVPTLGRGPPPVLVRSFPSPAHIYPARH